MYRWHLRRARVLRFARRWDRPRWWPSLLRSVSGRLRVFRGRARLRLCVQYLRSEQRKATCGRVPRFVRLRDRGLRFSRLLPSPRCRNRSWDRSRLHATRCCSVAPRLGYLSRSGRLQDGLGDARVSSFITVPASGGMHAGPNPLSILPSASMQHRLESHVAPVHAHSAGGPSPGGVHRPLNWRPTRTQNPSLQP